MLHTMLFVQTAISYSSRTPVLMKNMRGGMGICIVSGISENAGDMQTSSDREVAVWRFTLIASESIEIDRKSWRTPSKPSWIHPKAGLAPWTLMNECSAWRTGSIENWKVSKPASS